MAEKKKATNKKDKDVILSEENDLGSSAKFQNDKKKNVKKTEVKALTKKEAKEVDLDKSVVAKKSIKKVKTEKKASAKKNVKKTEKKSRLDRRAKKYREVFTKIEKGREYSIEEATALVKDLSTTKFDGSVEIHLNLNIDPKNPDQQIRGSVSLPAGLGRKKRVAVICKEVREKEAKAAGADLVGGTELIEKISKGKIDFEVLVATPDMMGELAKAGKVLGPKGLMPNPKDNTVADNLEATISDIKKGRAEYRADSYGIVHSVVGKVSFTEDKLLENIQAFLREIHNIKPSGVKSNYIKSIYLTTTMGPSIKIKE